MDGIDKINDNELPSRKRTTLKLSDKLKVNDLSNKFTLKKSVTTIEVRKKKRGSLSTEGYPITLQDAESNSLTVQEQISRINAIHNATLLVKNDAKKVDVKELNVKKESDVIVGNSCTMDSEEQINEVQQDDNKVSDLIDSNTACNDVKNSLEEINNIIVQENDIKSESAEEKKLKKYEKDYDEKKSGVKKSDLGDLYSKHTKLLIEEALEEDTEKNITKIHVKCKKNKFNKSIKNKIQRKVLIPCKITVQKLANIMAEKSRDVLQVLSQMGINLTLNDELNADQACAVVLKFNHTYKLSDSSYIESNVCKIDNVELKSRPPVVAIMGHVDHGKTTLLDAIRQSNIAQKEFKGITQHIGAYQIDVDGKKITFIDTPGHEAFSSMRARGTNITDIVVLVVAADDGVMVQTIESISHVKAANVAMIVAINKIDKHDADIQKITNDLLQHGVIPEELGGDVMLVPVSAKTGENLDKLKSSILLIAELLDLKAAFDCKAQGVVIESKVDKSMGIVTTVIIQQGTLKKGDIVVVGNNSYGKVRVILNDNNELQKEALPSMPVQILGLNNVPCSGDKFVVVDSEKQAKDLLDYRHKNMLQDDVKKKLSLEMYQELSLRKKVEDFNLILKCDVMGSIEAVSHSINHISNEEVRFNILHSGIGNVVKSDIMLAEVSRSLILAFNVSVDSQTRELAKQKGIEIRHYKVIYDIIDDVKGMLNGMLVPLQQEIQIGALIVRQVFSSVKAGSVIGCYVTSGVVKKGSMIKLLRNDDVIYEGKIKALKRFKIDVKEVSCGFECGILIGYTGSVEVGDIVNVLEIVEK
ncbi:translation initiation factor IF-2 [Neoehrlichia mikurensis]|uniref:Translation initiation factor IF-2 n=1 Tax=Neoehrlichia mikurensis TaxID=89586 RepID=A0A9Q9BUL8_9RICK|nr:translation initiation factor IF-2 [Neoehrlichia mikurensis]QXK91993.1 translation initiation factor IF-2 [Neoehrlichia mikurensis]QXK92450.1 translation initiation factor IF-2 [Neoehrlichia mikurensis]QXK93685.1 translation initiation factor IF-2 [Neoehrlichia mikurensis]UTO55343.1 translation initiation factor IF-2 [Neoehrlichia mikurensis]UTO56264.1 translation initiation factor IF-2 [Neoehrlichia mikurensis]